MQRFGGRCRRAHGLGRVEGCWRGIGETSRLTARGKQSDSAVVADPRLRPRPLPLSERGFGIWRRRAAGRCRRSRETRRGDTSAPGLVEGGREIQGLDQLTQRCALSEGQTSRLCEACMIITALSRVKGSHRGSCAALLGILRRPIRHKAQIPHFHVRTQGRCFPYEQPNILKNRIAASDHFVGTVYFSCHELHFTRNKRTNTL